MGQKRYTSQLHDALTLMKKKDERFGLLTSLEEGRRVGGREGGREDGAEREFDGEKTTRASSAFVLSQRYCLEVVRR